MAPREELATSHLPRSVRTALALAAFLAPILAGDAARAGDRTLLVLHKGAESLGFYDPASGRSLAVVPVGTVPHEMALSADRRLAYVTNYGVRSYTDEAAGGNTITIVDLARREKVGEIDLGACRRPHGIERGRSGRLYVTVDTPGSLLVLDPDKRAVLARHDVGQALPHMVAVAEDEAKAWVANAGAGTVTAVHLGSPAGLTQIAVGGVPMGLAVSSDGRRVFVATRNGNEVVVIDARKDAVEHRIAVPGQPARLCFTRGDARLLVSLMESGEVAVVDPRALREIVRFKVGASPEGLGLDEAHGFGFVSAQAEARVIKFSLRDYRQSLAIATAAQPDPVILLEEAR